MTLSGNDRQLILYATPTGPLSAMLNEYFDHVITDVGPTEAQEYPPHVSLTGFFRRSTTRADQIGAQVKQLLTAWGTVPADAVKVTGLSVEAGWVGLTIDSPWLSSLTRAFIDGQEILDDEDRLRPKDWLHLSLAYGMTEGSLERHGQLARALIDPALDAGWEVALWERMMQPSGPVWFPRT